MDFPVPPRLAMTEDGAAAEDAGNECFVRWSENISASRGGSQMRFYAQNLIELRNQLSERAISLISKLEFDPCLSMSLNDLCSRALIVWIVSKCTIVKYNNEDAILLNVDPKSPRLITPDVLKIIHGFPRGRAEVPHDILEPDAELKDLYSPLLDVKGDLTKKKTSNLANFITLDDVKQAHSKAKRANDTILEVRLFIAALLNFTSFTTSSFYLTKKNLEYVLSIKKITTNDWCKLLFDHMKDGLESFRKSETVWSPVSYLIFFLDNLDCDATTGDSAMNTPRMQYYTKSMVANVVNLLKAGIKLKQWEMTVYGRNGIPKVQPDEIEYIVVPKEDVKKRPILHETSDAKKNVKKRPILHETSDAKKNVKKRSRLHETSGAEEDSYVRVPSLEKLLAPSLKELPSDMVIKANNIIGTFQSSLVNSIEQIIKTQMMDCASALKELLQTTPKQVIDTPKQVIDTFYEKHVLSKIHMTKEDESGKRTVANIGTFQLSEYDFVSIFRPDGWMSNWLVQALTNFWNREWDGENVIVDLSPVDMLLSTGNNDRLLKLLRSKIVLGHTKLIFIPILRAWHWFLDVLNASQLDVLNASIRSSLNDCGFYMLAFTRRIAEGGDIDNIDNRTIIEFRKELAKLIFDHIENLIIDESGGNEDVPYPEEYYVPDPETTPSGPQEKEIPKTVLETSPSGDATLETTPSGDATLETTPSGPQVPEIAPSGDVTNAKNFRTLSSVIKNGPRDVPKTKSKKNLRIYVDTVNLSDEDIISRIKLSEISSPFSLYKRTEPPADKAIELMKHIFDKYGDHSTILIDYQDSVDLNFLVQITGKMIKEEFNISSWCGAACLVFFIYCLRNDDRVHRSKSIGYRVIIEPQIAVDLISKTYDSNKVAALIRNRYKVDEFTSAHHIFVPIFHQGHWTLYVINFRNQQIDILDSLKRSPIANDNLKKLRLYHNVFGKSLIANLYSQLLDFVGEKITDFSDYPRTFIKLPYQIKHSNDCCFHVMIYLEHYDADTRVLKYKFPETSEELRAKSLHYMMSSRVNQVQLPADVKNLL